MGSCVTCLARCGIRHPKHALWDVMGEGAFIRKNFDTRQCWVNVKVRQGQQRSSQCIRCQSVSINCHTYSGQVRRFHGLAYCIKVNSRLDDKQILRPLYTFDAITCLHMSFSTTIYTIDMNVMGHMMAHHGARVHLC